jgi:uncharacterized membrane protein
MEVAGLMVLGVLCWITYAALNGTQPLPDRIPTHFDISGNPNAWGSPQILWLLPALGTGLYLLMTLLASIRFRSFNLPVRVTETNIPFIQAKAGEMVAWIKFEVLGLFTFIQWSIIEGAQAGQFHLSLGMIPIFLAAVFATVGVYLAAIIRGARARADSADPINQF